MNERWRWADNDTKQEIFTKNDVFLTFRSFLLGSCVVLNEERMVCLFFLKSLEDCFSLFIYLFISIFPFLLVLRPFNIFSSAGVTQIQSLTSCCVLRSFCLTIPVGLNVLSTPSHLGVLCSFDRFFHIHFTVFLSIHSCQSFKVSSPLGTTRIQSQFSCWFYDFSDCPFLQV